MVPVAGCQSGGGSGSGQPGRGEVGVGVPGHSAVQAERDALGCHDIPRPHGAVLHLGEVQERVVDLVDPVVGGGALTGAVEPDPEVGDRSQLADVVGVVGPVAAGNRHDSGTGVVGIEHDRCLLSIAGAVGDRDESAVDSRQLRGSLATEMHAGGARSLSQWPNAKY